MFKEVLLLALIVLSLQKQCNGTTTNYISEHSLGQQDEINDTTAIICPDISLKTLSVSFEGGSVTLSNITLKCEFFDGSQVAKAGNDTLTVSGGKIEFQTNFALSINQSGEVKNGSGYASVFSDATNFTKYLHYGSGSNLNWFLNADNTKNVSITQNFTLRRHTPSNISAAALLGISNALNTVQSSIKSQIVAQYNKNFINVLNKTLGQQKIFNPQFNYSYHVKGEEINVTFKNNVTQFGVSEKDGLVLSFNTYIKGEEIDCQFDLVPHEDYIFFGGIQTFHSFDLYRHILNYNVKNKLIDSTVDSAWNTNSFQFYAGDLYQIIPRTKSLGPRTRLAGECSAKNDSNLQLKRNSTDKYQITVNYNCEIHTESQVKVVQFEILVKYYIQVKLSYENIHFTIFDISGVPVFKSAGQYIVSNLQLAKFKVNEVLKSMVGHKVFGDNFPSWPRDFPQVQVRNNQTFFYDSSHIPHIPSLADY